MAAEKQPQLTPEALKEVLEDEKAPSDSAEYAIWFIARAMELVSKTWRDGSGEEKKNLVLAAWGLMLDKIDPDDSVRRVLETIAQGVDTLYSVATHVGIDIEKLKKAADGCGGCCGLGKKK